VRRVDADPVSPEGTADPRGREAPDAAELPVAVRGQREPPMEGADDPAIDEPPLPDELAAGVRGVELPSTRKRDHGGVVEVPPPRGERDRDVVRIVPPEIPGDLRRERVLRRPRLHVRL